MIRSLSTEFGFVREFLNPAVNVAENDLFLQYKQPRY